MTHIWPTVVIVIVFLNFWYVSVQIHNKCHSVAVADLNKFTQLIPLSFWKQTSKQKHLLEAQGLNKRQIYPVRTGSKSPISQTVHTRSDEPKVVKVHPCSPTSGDRNNLLCLQLPHHSRWALWEVNGENVTLWSGDSLSFFIMEDNSPNTLLCLNTVKRIAWTVFIKTEAPQNRHVSHVQGSLIT